MILEKFRWSISQMKWKLSNDISTISVILNKGGYQLRRHFYTKYFRVCAENQQDFDTRRKNRSNPLITYALIFLAVHLLMELEMHKLLLKVIVHVFTGLWVPL